MTANTFGFVFEWYQGDFLFDQFEGECEVQWLGISILPKLHIRLEAICNKTISPPRPDLPPDEYVAEFRNYQKALTVEPPAELRALVEDWLWKNKREEIDDAEYYDRFGEERLYA